LKHGRTLDSPGRIGIVTVTYNSGAYLDAFFQSCYLQNMAEWRLYAIDNASADDSAAQLNAAAAHDPRIVVTLNAHNGGIAEGNNQGIVQALEDGCEWVLLLNNDTTFPSALFADLVSACEQMTWAVCVPKIHYDTPAGHIWFGGGGFNPRRGHTGFHTSKDELDKGQCDTPGTIDYSPTCCMLVHRSVFDKVGLMDESYFVYFDDTDFCWRLRQHQIAIGYWPAATLVHKVGGSTGGGDSPFTARMTARNRLYFLKKYFGPAKARLWSLVFVPYYAARYLLRRWNPACFRASIEGTLAYAKMQPRIPRMAPSSRP
jgi:GT2 family glycosyltransferase